MASVLVAEDDDNTRQVICETLKVDGWDVEAYADGDGLLSALKHRFDHVGAPPDLVVTDIRMPGFSGLEVVDRLRRFDKVTPVIFITAFRDEKIQAAAEDLGLCKVLTKPLELNALRQAAAALGDLT